jgi:acyl carrier protein
LIAARLGINSDAVRDGDWQELGIDSLDLVEFVMDLEE